MMYRHLCANVVDNDKGLKVMIDICSLLFPFLIIPGHPGPHITAKRQALGYPDAKLELFPEV